MCVTYLGDLALKYCMRWEQGLLIPAYVHVYKVEFRMPLRNLKTFFDKELLLLHFDILLIHFYISRLLNLLDRFFYQKLLSCQKK